MGKRDRTRAHIIASTAELLERRSWDDITMDDIAEEADVGRTTVFSQFGSKDSLLELVCLDAVVKFTGGSDPWPTTALEMVARTHLGVEKREPVIPAIRWLHRFFADELGQRYRQPNDSWLTVDQFAWASMAKICLCMITRDVPIFDAMDRFEEAYLYLGSRANGDTSGWSEDEAQPAELT